MICPNCNKIIAEGSKECPFCGALFSEKEGVKAKKRVPKFVIVIGVLLLLSLMLVGGFSFATDRFIESDVPLKEETFSDAEQALQAYEAYETKRNDINLDYCPPYELKYSFEAEENVDIIYSSCRVHGGDKNDDYAVRVLRKTDDGKLAFDFGFCVLPKSPPVDENNYYWMTIHTSNGKKSLGIFYLPKDDQRDIYFDGNKADKKLITVDDDAFYLCYAVSSKRDTTLKNLFTPISKRHKIEIK